MTTLIGRTGSAFTITDEQIADGASDNVLFRKFCGRGPVGLVIANVRTASGTTTLTIQGSADGTNWYAIPYALVATPSTFVVTALTLTTTATTTYLLQPDQAWMYLRTLMASTTDESVTVTAYP